MAASGRRSWKQIPCRGGQTPTAVGARSRKSPPTVRARHELRSSRRILRRSAWGACERWNVQWKCSSPRAALQASARRRAPKPVSNWVTIGFDVLMDVSLHRNEVSHSHGPENVLSFGFIIAMATSIGRAAGKMHRRCHDHRMQCWSGHVDSMTTRPRRRSSAPPLRAP